MVVGDLTNGIGRFLWSSDHRIARLWRREWPAKLALVRALSFVTSVTHDGYIRAVYTKENKPRLTLAAAYIRRKRNHLYEYGLY